MDNHYIISKIYNVIIVFCYMLVMFC